MDGPTRAALWRAGHGCAGATAAGQGGMVVMAVVVLRGEPVLLDTRQWHPAGPGWAPGIARAQST